jgi:hypothetical protein
VIRFVQAVGYTPHTRGYLGAVWQGWREGEERMAERLGEKGSRALEVSVRSRATAIRRKEAVHSHYQEPALGSPNWLCLLTSYGP